MDSKVTARDLLTQADQAIQDYVDKDVMKQVRDAAKNGFTTTSILFSYSEDRKVKTVKEILQRKGLVVEQLIESCEEASDGESHCGCNAWYYLFCCCLCWRRVYRLYITWSNPETKKVQDTISTPVAVVWAPPPAYTPKAF